MVRKDSMSLVLLVFLLILPGCTLTPFAFQRMAGNAGSEFAAASTTLRYAHERKITFAKAKALGPVGAYLFASALFATCLGAALEVALAVSYNIAQGFGWEWSENKKPVEAARFNLVLIIFLAVTLALQLLERDPLQLAFLASTVIALFLPISLAPFLFVMNDPEYLGTYTNGAWNNLAIICILVLAFGVAVISLPLEILTGGG